MIGFPCGFRLIRPKLSCSAACHSRFGPIHCQAISRVFRFFGSTRNFRDEGPQRIVPVERDFGLENKDRGRFSDEAAPSTREQTREYRLKLSFLAFHGHDPIRSDQSDKRASVLLCSCHKIHSTKSTLCAKHMNQFDFSVRQLMPSLRIYRRVPPIAGG